MKKATCLTLAGLLLSLAIPGRAGAQALYVVSPPTTATAPAYSGWASFQFMSGGTSNGDYGLATLPLGFSFSFYGKSYTSVDVTADGILLFENEAPYTKTCTGSLVSACYNPKNIPDPTAPNAMISLWMDDMQTNSSNGAETTISGTAPSRIFSIRYTGWGGWTYSGVISPRNVQVDLHEDTGAIEVYYGTISSPSASNGNAGLGIEDSAGANGLPGLACANTTTRCTDADWPTGKRISYAPAIDPDLMVLDVVGSPLVATTVAGQPGYRLDVSVTAKNQGQNPAVGFLFDLWLCNQPSVVTNDPTKCNLLVSHSTPATLAGHAQATYTESGVQFVKPAAGTFYIGAYLDPPTAGKPNGNVVEALETNNTGVSMGYIIGIDLLGSISGPSNAGPGDDAAMQVTIQNRGTDPTAVPFTYQLWIAKTTTLDPINDKLFYTGTVAAIGGGETQQLLPPAKLPMVLDDGQYRYIMLIDPSAVGKPNGDIIEVDETNNTAVSSAQVTISASDLIVTDVAVKSPTAPYADTTQAFFGEDVRVTFKVTNAGGGTAKNFFVCVLLSDSPFISLFDQDITPAGAPLANLTYVGAYYETFDDCPDTTHCKGHIEVTIPTLKASGVPYTDGTFYIGVIVDCHNTVPESNKANNKAAGPNPLHIRQPAMDLTPVQVQAPAAAAVGELMPVFRVIRSIGNRGDLDPGTSAPFEYRYYLSSNPIISAEDVPLSLVDAVTGATKDHGEDRLGAQGSVDGSGRPTDVSRKTELVLVPADVSPGIYYVGIVVDPANKIVELDKTNNSLGSLGTVEVAASSLFIDTGSLPDALVGVDYRQELVASGGSGGYQWTIDATQGGPPAGILLSADGVLSGQATEVGVFVFTVKVTSASGTALARLALRSIVPTGPLAVVSSNLPSAIQGIDYSVDLAAVGGVRPYTWLLYEGALPDGLLLSQAGKISGKLTRALGNVAFTVSVTDAFGTHALGALTMRAVEPGTLFVATVKLGEAQVGVPYRQGLQAVGGTSPYTWTIKDGSAPEGLKLSGNSILGTPSKAGHFPMVVEVADSAGYTDRGSFILTVTPRPASFTLPVDVVPEAKPGEDYALNLSPGAKPHTRFELYGGELPPGLSLDVDGRITGTVPKDAAPRSYDCVLLLTEDAGAQALIPLTIRVLPPPAAPPSQANGGGCSSAGAGLAPFALLFALPLLLRRRRSRASAITLVGGAALALLCASPARANYRLLPVASTPFAPLVGATVVQLDPVSGEQTVTMPFSFRFWGDTFSAVNISCRGYLAFGSGSANADCVEDDKNNIHTCGHGIPAAATPFPLIAPWWGSWECRPGSVSFLVQGVAPQRSITFQWDHVWYTPDTSGTSSHGATFQARLYETTNKIEFAYGPSSMSLYAPPTQDKAPLAAVGIQDNAGAHGVAGLSCTTGQPATGSGAQCKVTDYAANTVVGFTQPPDLIPDRVYADDLAYAGVPMRMGATVLNQGGEDARNVGVRFYLNTTGTLDTVHDTVLCQEPGHLCTTRAIDVAVGQRRDVLLTPTFPTAFGGTTFYLFAVVDPDNVVAEDKENNNTAQAPCSSTTTPGTCTLAGSGAFGIGPPTADLVVDSVTVDKTTAKAGDSLSVTRIIKNIGNALSGPCALPADCGAGYKCDAGRCRKTCAVTGDCPTGLGLTCGAGLFCETPACTTDDVCLAGEGCVAGACARKPITYKVFLSQNPVITLADRLLTPAPGVVSLANGILAFAQDTASDTVSLPADLAPGQYWVGVIVNPNLDLPEILVVNNSGATAGPITVTSDSLALAPRTLPDAQLSTPYSAQLWASGGDGVYLFSLANSTTLPAGLSLSTSGEVWGLPTAVVAAKGFDVQVTSAGKSATGSFTLNVTRADLPLTVVTHAVPAAEFGKPYSTLMVAVGGQPPYSWALAQGANLPLGVSLAQDGTLEGVSGKDGTFAFEVEVTDSAGAKATQPLSLSVVAPDRVRIATSTLPDGFLGKPYLAPLQAVGGRPAYAWSVVEVQAVPLDPTDPAVAPTVRLPDPLQLVTDSKGARIVGVPTVSGSFIVTLKVADMTGAEDNASFVLNLRFDRGLSISTVSLPDALVGKVYQATLAANAGDTTGKLSWSITCTPRYDDKGQLQPCQELTPPGITLAADGTVTTAAVNQCNLPVDSPKGCPDGLTCALDGHCVLKSPAPDANGHVAAHTIYSFLVRAEEDKTGRSAMKALSITVRVDTPPTQPPPSKGCATGGAGAALWPAALALLSLLKRRRSARARFTAPLSAFVAAAAALALFALGCGSGKTPKAVTRCDNVVCTVDGYSCDPGDGVCKCGGEGGTICAATGVCTGGVCVYACPGLTCDRGTTPDPLDCACKCGTSVCSAGYWCDAASRSCFLPDKCQGVTCGATMTCDATDGKCKCGGVECPAGQTCKASLCVVDPCAGVNCEGGQLCDSADGVCKCGAAAGRACVFGEQCLCPAGDACKDEERRCANAQKCEGKVCSAGTTCDPSDGQCRCGGPAGPVCQYGQSCDVLRKICLGGDRCLGVVCLSGLSCDPEDGACKCGGVNGVNGVVCNKGDVCATFQDGQRACVTPCDPRVQPPSTLSKCAVGQGCYFDMFAQLTYCDAAGKKTEPMGCNTAKECAPGFHCQQKPNQTGKCRRYCNVPDGPSGCPQMQDSEECVQLDGADHDVGACDLAH